MTCEGSGSTAGVRFYDDPETDEQVALCESCAVELTNTDDDPFEQDEENLDDEFADTCITAADYFREGDY
jgi:hypothetical protein